MVHILHLIKHPIAAAAVVAGACVLWTVVYVLLIAWAVVFDHPLGGLLAYPAGLLFWSVAGGVASVLVFMPATIIGGAVVLNFQLKPWWGLLISVLLLPVFAFIALWFGELVAPKYAVSNTVKNAVIFAAICLVPLISYWSLLKGLDWLLGFMPKQPAIVGSCGCLSFVPLFLIVYLVSFLVIFDMTDAASRRDLNSNLTWIGPRPRCCCEPLDDPIHYSGDEWCFVVFSPLLKLHNYVFNF